MINTQTQIDSLIDLAVLQRTELKQLVDSLPQLRDHLSSEIERNLEEIEPAIRSELEQFVAARALDTQAKTSAELSAKLDAMARNLESTTAAKYSVLMAERAQNATLLAQAEARIAEAASALPGAVKGIVTDELARFPRAGEIDQLRKEFAEPRGLNPRGRWQVGETYNKLDLVSYNGDSYVSNTNGNREKPSRSSEAWTLSAARGNGGAGGGVTSLTDLVAVPANGELLIGNGSAFVNNTITGGTGVTVTNGPGTITIDASGAQEILTATVTNAESFAITRGQVVYLFGATGNRASVKLADNTNDAASSKTFGIVSQASISAGGNGLITCVGQVNQLTLGTYTEGDVLYLDATPGAFTKVKPYAPNHLVYVGMVERANNGNGELYVRIQNGFELDEIHDVQITTPPLAGSLLMRDATTSLWKANRLTGTANQVTVTNADTSVTLSLPTAIANVNSVTAATTQNLTLAGGSTGASLVLGQGASGNAVITPSGTANLLVPNGTMFIQSGSLSVGAGTTSAGVGYFRGTANTWTPSYNSNYGELFLGNSLAGAGINKITSALSFSQAMDSTLKGAAIVGVQTNTDSEQIGLAFYTHPSTFGSVSMVEALRITDQGNLLIGTTTDSGNGKLQLATHTTSAGGIGFGTDTSLYRVYNGNLALDHTNGTNPVFYLRESGSGKGYLQTNNGNVTLGSLNAGAILYLQSGNATTALTLASNQAATFAGAVTAGGKVTITGSSSGTGLGTAFTTGTANAAGVYFADIYTNSSAGGITGLLVQPTLSGNGQLAFTGIDSQVLANNITVGTIKGLHVYNPQTSGSTVTTIAGLDIDSISGATNNFAIRTGSGRVSIGDATPSGGAGSGALQVAGGIYAGAASVFGDAVKAPYFDVSGTGNYIRFFSRTTPGSYTQAQLFQDGDFLWLYGAGTWRFRVNVTNGDLVCKGKINAASLPTSSAGLSAGDIWNDSGTLKIV